MSLRVYACIWARRFATQALLRLRPELRGTAVAVLDGERPLEIVCCLNAQAAHMGATTGMTRAQMETTGVPVCRRDAASESSARAALLALLQAFTPQIEDSSAGTDCVLTMDLTGTARAFGTPAEVARRIRTQARTMFLHVDAGISHNFAAAQCVAASAHGRILEVPYGYEAQALASLPLSALRPAQDLAETFSAWGIRTAGELAALPTRELTSRTGERGRALQQKARGEYPHLFQPMAPAAELKESLSFDEPIELLEPLLFVLNVLLEQLLLRTAASLQALAAVTVLLALEGGGTHTRSVKPALPTQDRAMLLKLLQLDLQAHPPSAGVLQVSLHGEAGSESKTQLGLFTPQHPEPMRMEVTLARIAAIVGEGNVGSPRLGDTHRPGAHLVEPFRVGAAAPNKSSPGSSVNSVTDTAHSNPSAALRRLRPALLIPCDAGRPAAFHYGETHWRIHDMRGPWRTSGEWWSARVWSEECWDFSAVSYAQGNGSVLLGVLAHDLLRRQWRLEALYD